MNSFHSRAFVFPDDFISQVSKSNSDIEERSRLQFILGMIICCMGLAIFFAPEKPQQYASICQKYNTVNACQVW